MGVSGTSNEGVLVHDGDGSKLDARAREGCWLGFDAESHGHRVYFPTSRSVATERNVYFGTSCTQRMAQRGTSKASFLSIEMKLTM